MFKVQALYVSSQAQVGVHLCVCRQLGQGEVLIGFHPDVLGAADKQTFDMPGRSSCSI